MQQGEGEQLRSMDERPVATMCRSEKEPSLSPGNMVKTGESHFTWQRLDVYGASRVSWEWDSLRLCCTRQQAYRMEGIRAAAKDCEDGLQRSCHSPVAHKLVIVCISALKWHIFH